MLIWQGRINFYSNLRLEKSYIRFLYFPRINPVCFMKFCFLGLCGPGLRGTRDWLSCSLARDLVLKILFKHIFTNYWRRYGVFWHLWKNMVQCLEGIKHFCATVANCCDADSSRQTRGLEDPEALARETVCMFLEFSVFMPDSTILLIYWHGYLIPLYIYILFFSIF